MDGRPFAFARTTEPGLQAGSSAPCLSARPCWARDAVSIKVLRMTEQKKIWFHADSTNIDYFLSAIKESQGWQVQGEPTRETRDGTTFLVYNATREA